MGFLIFLLSNLFKYMLYGVVLCDIIEINGVCFMKLNYDRKSKDPTYFIQMGIRNGKKTTTKNIKRIGKHSELLAITSNPLAYAQEQVLLSQQPPLQVVVCY